MKKKIKIDLIDFWFPNTSEGKRQSSVYMFLERLLAPDYEFEISEKPDFLIYSVYSSNHLHPCYDQCVKIFLTQEDRRPDFSECDYAFTFDYLQHDRHFRLPNYRTEDWWYSRIKEPQDPKAILAQKTKFCCFIVSNQNAAFRINFFQTLSGYKRVDSAGRALNNLGYNIPFGNAAKLEFMRSYKFCIAFENTEQPGYTTEKLVHAFAANTVPIYWGNPAVAQDFNTKAFINYFDHGSIEASIREVIRVDQDPKLYAQYISESPLIGGKDLPTLTDHAIATKFREIFEQGRICRNIYTRLKTKFYHRGMRFHQTAAYLANRIRSRLMAVPTRLRR